MPATLVEFPNPQLTDIPAMLRLVADQIENGERGEVSSAFMILPQDGDFPTLFGWGQVTEPTALVMQLNLALHWLLSQQVTR